jgi:hypothetical protein
LTAEVLTLRGLVTYYVLFFNHFESRRVDIVGITVHPDERWMQQMARNVTMEGYGALRDCRYLLHDRYIKYTQSSERSLHALDVLPLEEAVGLLQSRSGYSDAAGAKTLAEALGNLPLAFDHAAAYCKRTQMRFADYAVKVSKLIAMGPRGAGYPRSVAATFNLAITQAVAQCPATEPIMAYLALCSPERIPMIIVEGAVTTKRSA